MVSTSRVRRERELRDAGCTFRSAKNFCGGRSAPVEGERLLNDWRYLTSYNLNNPLVVVGEGIATSRIK